VFDNRLFLVFFRIIFLDIGMFSILYGSKIDYVPNFVIWYLDTENSSKKQRQQIST